MPVSLEASTPMRRASYFGIPRPGKTPETHRKTSEIFRKSELRPKNRLFQTPQGTLVCSQGSKAKSRGPVRSHAGSTASRKLPCMEGFPSHLSSPAARNAIRSPQNGRGLWCLQLNEVSAFGGSTGEEAPPGPAVTKKERGLLASWWCDLPPLCD